MSLDVSLGAAFLAGLLSFLSPCILPLVPPFLCYMAGVSAADLSAGEGAPRGRIMAAALAFVAGFTTVFVILGATASALGKAVAPYMSTLSMAAGALIVLMGLHFTGLVRIPLLYRSATIEVGAKPAGLVGAFLMGLAFAFGWTPCAGPILAAVLFMAGAEDTVMRGVALLLAYAAGTGAPFLIAAAFTGQFMAALRRFRAHLGTVEKVMGGFLIVTGLVFLTGAMPTISFWLLEKFPVLGKIG